MATLKQCDRCKSIKKTASLHSLTYRNLGRHYGDNDEITIEICDTCNVDMNDFVKNIRPVNKRERSDDNN